MKKFIYLFFMTMVFFSCGHGTSNKPDDVVVPDDKWTKVKYAELEDYLSQKAKKGEVNYIWVIEVAKENLQGGKSGFSYEPSELGKILQGALDVNVALKLDERIEGLSRMSAAFVNCKNLVSVENIPIGVENLEMCFAGCGILEEVKNIPNTVKSLKNCFTTCAFLKTPPIIPEGVEDMSDCFAFCTELETPPILPKTVTNLEECFLSCLKLKKAPEIPENVTNMASMFVQCFALEEMPEIPCKVERFRHAFMGCEGLKKTKAIPESVNDMQGAFLGCKEITSIALNCKYNNEKGGASPEREGYFFENAFVGCEKLGEKSITVPSAYLADYKKGATKMGVSENCFVGK